MNKLRLKSGDLSVPLMFKMAKVMVLNKFASQEIKEVFFHIKRVTNKRKKRYYPSFNLG